MIFSNQKVNTMKLATIYAPFKKDLRKIENQLMASIDAEHPILQDASLQLIKAGGKRIRPVFVLLSSQFGNPDANNSDVQATAVALELIHMATLVHDDVVDDAALRRGKPTIKYRYGNRTAVYTGDYILARALEIITTIQNQEVHRVLANTLVKVVEGEIKQIADKHNFNQTLRAYLQRIKRKTALLIAMSCKLGALASEAPKEYVRYLYQYGYHVGMSFQIIDDILDFTASPKELGKPTGSDLIQGNITLPVLFALEDDAFRAKVTQLFSAEQPIDAEMMEWLIDDLKRTGAIEKSYQISNRYLHKAIRSVNKLPDHNAKKSLQIIADIIGKRRY